MRLPSTRPTSRPLLPAGEACMSSYGARPPLSAVPDGRLRDRLKRPLPCGREVLVLQPTELLRRLVTLVPPRGHLVRYHGVFGPDSAWRAEIVPRSPQAGAVAGQPAEPELPHAAAPPSPVTPPGPGPGAERSAPVQPRIPWSELLLHVFREDVLRCPCGVASVPVVKTATRFELCAERSICC